MARLWHKALRRVFACTLAYALVLQGLVFALDISRPAFAARAGTAWAGFELCSHSGSGSPLPNAPAQGPIGNIHCIFCIAGAAYVTCTPACAVQCGNVVITGAVWLPAAPRLVALRINASAWPRGPPVAA